MQSKTTTPNVDQTAATLMREQIRSKVILCCIGCRFGRTDRLCRLTVRSGRVDLMPVGPGQVVGADLNAVGRIRGLRDIAKSKSQLTRTGRDEPKTRRSGSDQRISRSGLPTTKRSEWSFCHVDRQTTYNPVSKRDLSKEHRQAVCFCLDGFIEVCVYSQALQEASSSASVEAGEYLFACLKTSEAPNW